MLIPFSTLSKTLAKELLVLLILIIFEFVIIKVKFYQKCFGIYVDKHVFLPRYIDTAVFSL